MRSDLKFVELTADVLEILLIKWVAQKRPTENVKVRAKNNIAKHFGTFRREAMVYSVIDHRLQHPHTMPHLRLIILEYHGSWRRQHQCDVFVHVT